MGEKLGGGGGPARLPASLSSLVVSRVAPPDKEAEAEAIFPKPRLFLAGVTVAWS